VATIVPSTGARTFVGFGIENQASPGVPVAITEYLPVDDHPSIDVNMGRKPLEVATGTLVIDKYLTEDGAESKGGFSFPLFHTIGQSLLASMGLSASGLVQAPQYLTIEVYRAGQSFIHSGMLPRSVKFELKSKQATKVTVEFDGIGRPTLADPSIDPTTYAWPADQPYVWGHTQPVLTIGGGSVASKFADNIEIDCMWDNQVFHGASGDTFPTLVVPGPVTVKGKVNILFTSIADYQSYITVGQTPGPMQFSVAQPGHSIVWDLPHVFYSAHKFSGGLKAPIVEECDWNAIAPDNAADLIHYTAA
jgi:hypothetical protein